MTLVVSSSSGSPSTFSIAPNELALFKQPFLDVTLDANPAAPRSSIVVTHFALSLPDRTRYGSYSDDPRLKATALLFLVAAILHLSRLAAGTPRVLGSAVGRIARFVRRHAVWLMAAALVTSVAYAIAAIPDGHPFDRLSQESWLYIIAHYGVGDLYARSSVIPDAAVRAGTAPWAPAGMAYGLFAVYPYWLLSAVYQLLGGQIPAPLSSEAFQIYWKTALSLGTFSVGVLVFAWRKVRDHSTTMWALAAAASYTLNPAVMFGNATWGQTDGILDTLLLGSLWAALASRETAALSLLGLGLMTKQTAFLFAAPVFAVVWARSGLARTLRAAANASVVVVALLSPLFLVGYRPDTITLPLTTKLGQASSAFTGYATRVSGDSFSLWTLVTGLEGRTGDARRAISDALPAAPGLPSYYVLSLILLAALGTALLVAGDLNLRRRLTDDRVAIHLMPALLYLLLSVGTRTVGKYLILGMPFLSLLLESSRLSRIALIAFSTASLGSMFGLFAWIGGRREWVFGVIGTPDSNPVTGAFYWLYASDLGIDLISLTIIVGLIAYVALGFREAHASARVGRQALQSALIVLVASTVGILVAGIR